MADVLIKNIDREAYKMAKVIASKERRRVGDVVTSAILNYSKNARKGEAQSSIAHRIEVAYSGNGDTRANARKLSIERMGFAGRVSSIGISDIYTIDAGLTEIQLEGCASMLANPVTQKFAIDKPIAPETFDWAIEVGYLPGVTDNVANTTRQLIEDFTKREFSGGEAVYFSSVTYIRAEISRDEAQSIGESLANPLIQRITVKSFEEFTHDHGMGLVIPKVRLESKPIADTVEILKASDAELEILGKHGINNHDGTTRGPLALDLSYMKAIKAHFAKLGRNPTDVELETIAQTWSEHCKHTIFRDPIDNVKDGIFRHYIRRATTEIRKAKGKDDFCVSVFSDNSGVIKFDDNHYITDKVETHNSPSALDPFGGAVTGIVGVNRDTIGTGMGAKPVINKYGFCFADPNDTIPIYRGPNRTQKMLLPRQIMDGVVAGVNNGGNCSGIPTPQGFVYFDKRYKGKPLVFVGTVGLLPKTVNGKPSVEKTARPGDLIVMVGGRVGQDGIHGATFSSEALEKGSPATAVQIGDPITQKVFSDALIKEARDRGLYSSITDDGAGGLSSSVGEMAKESGGCVVELDKVPLKYPNLEPWKIWISESQERMTLAVPKEKWNELNSLLKKRGSEATIIGRFTDSGKCVVEFKGQKVVDLDLGFLHDGLPQRPMKTERKAVRNEEPIIETQTDLTPLLSKMIARQNIASYEYIPMQYDHEVQGGSVVKPIVGKGRVIGDATVTRPVIESERGVVLSYGYNPSYSDIDTYQMAANAIDSAIRNAVSVGADPASLALLDNFCWCSSYDPVRLSQLLEAARSCYDYAIAYGTPFISGKDSMFNDFSGYDELGNKVRISIPPTLLVSAIGVLEDSKKAVTPDAKFEGDLVYIIGDTFEEMGGSEFYAMKGEEIRGSPFVGNTVPKVDAKKNLLAYSRISKAISEGLIASVQPIGRGGIAIALAKSTMAGRLGMQIQSDKVPGKWKRMDFMLFSESSGRLVATVSEKNAKSFEQTLGKVQFARIGIVTKEPILAISDKTGKKVVKIQVDGLLASYKSTFAGY